MSGDSFPKREGRGIALQGDEGALVQKDIDKLFRSATAMPSIVAGGFMPHAVTHKQVSALGTRCGVANHTSVMVAKVNNLAD